MDKERYSNIAIYVSLVFKIIGIFLGIATIFMLVWKVFGHSPSSESVMLFSMSLLATLVCGIIVITFTTMYRLGKIDMDITYMKKNQYFMMKDLREIKNHLKMSS